MTLALTITDNQDGSGATATITGSAVGSTNTVFTVSVPQLQLYNLVSFPPPAWVVMGQRSGDGNVVLSVPFVPGYYWAYLYSQVGSGPPTIAPPQYFVASPNAQSVFQQIRLAVQAKIQGLSLPPIAPAPTGITSDRVYLQGVPFGGLQKFPCVIISDEDEQETVGVSTNLTEDIAYPIRVFIADRQGVPFDVMVPTYLLWRERIMSAFRSQRLATVAAVMANASVQPHVAISAEMAAKYQHVVSGMTLRFVARQTRG